MFYRLMQSIRRQFQDARKLLYLDDKLDKHIASESNDSAKRTDVICAGLQKVNSNAAVIKSMAERVQLLERLNMQEDLDADALESIKPLSVVARPCETRLLLASPGAENGCQTDLIDAPLPVSPMLCDAASQTPGDIDLQDLLKSTQIQLRDAEEALLGTKLVADSRWDKMCDLRVLERALRDENSALLNEKSALQDENSALRDENSTCEELVHEQDRMIEVYKKREKYRSQRSSGRYSSETSDCE